jgi:hypothetical protein
MLKPIFMLVLEDNSNFVGGTEYTETKWKEIPKDKKIKRVFYNIPKGDTLCLSGYDTYAHLVEVTKDINGSKAGQVNLEYAYIMGRKDDAVKCYKINLQNSELIICKDYNINDDFIKSIAKHCWK